MSRQHLSWVVMIVAVFMTIGTASAYPPPGGGGNGGGQGGGNGGGGGGGGGEDPPSPANPEIAYLEDGAVWVMNADGSNQTPLFEGGVVHSVSWSTDGTQLAMTADVGELFGIWTIDADGTNLSLVKEMHWTSYLWDLQWSPAPTADGFEKVLFIELTDEGPDGTFDVFAINADGTGLAHLVNTPLPYMEVACTWSPDATRIAVIEDELDMMIVYDLGLVGGALGVTGSAEIPNLPPSLDDVDWARTQNRVAVSSFVAGSANNSELWIIDLDDETSRFQITFDEDWDGMPSWSPDDTQLAYFRSASSRKEKGIRTVSSDGLSDRSLGVRSGINPDWKR
ncbi:MAG: TolB family protein [Planctomycetota bacterium]|jgi:Tol biopolymer transport system component